MGIYAKTTEGWQEIGAGAAGADLVGGVAGWAAIESVTGTASLDDLKTAGIAPATATADSECPGTYNIVGDDGVVYRVAVFTGDGSISTSGGIVDALLCGSGGCEWSAAVSCGARIVTGLHELPQGSADISVGQAVGGVNKDGEHSYLNGQDGVFAKGGEAYNASKPGAGPGSSGIVSGITGSDVEYCHGGGDPSQTGPGSGNPAGGQYSQRGIVVVRAPKDAANNPKPDAPVAWGDFTTNGDEQDSGTYGPDAQGRTWKWAEWNVANDYTVNLTGGQYWVLTVGGGDGGWNNVLLTDQGQPGLVREGYWEFNSGPQAITVGAKGATQAQPEGYPSSIADFGTQGISSWGSGHTGRGATADKDPDGYESMITGTLREFATGCEGADVPGRGRDPVKVNANTQRDGCVIIATVTNEQSDWNPPGALPGLGGWATIQSVSGMPNRYTYNDGTTDWVAFEWLGPNGGTGYTNGTITVKAGLLDALVCGGGQPSNTNANNHYGAGGQLNMGIELIPDGEHPINVGAPGGGGNPSVNAMPSQLFPFLGAAGGNGGWLGAGFAYGETVDLAAGVSSSITGDPVVYCAAGSAGITAPGCGGGSGNGGAVIIRVPADLAAGVDPTTYNDITTFDLAKDAAKTAVKEAVKDKRKKR